MTTGNDISNLASSLFPGKAQRASDLASEFSGYSESRITESLELLVDEGVAEKYVHYGETYYLKKVEN